jgi:Fic family protein
MALFRSASLDAGEAKVVEAITHNYKQLKYALSTGSVWTDVLRRDALARAICGSSSIDGYRLEPEDAVAAVEGKQLRYALHATWQAITGYRDAFTCVLQMTKDPNFSFDEGFLRGLHFLMLRHDLDKNPGNWRPGPTYVWDAKRKKNIYEGPSAEEARKLISELVVYLNSSADSTHYFIRGAMAHLNLAMIHPFSGGNGRMARCLQTLVLALSGIVDPTFCSIEEYLGANRQDYYRSLAEVGQGSWHPHNDTRPWIRFSLTAHYRQSLTALRRTRTISKLWNGLEREIQGTNLPDRVIYALADAARGLRLRSSNYSHMAQVSNLVATHDLTEMVKAGLLVPHGERGGRSYIASEAIRQMAILIRSQEPDSIRDPFAPEAVIND